jgi:hypothetical protein
LTIVGGQPKTHIVASIAYGRESQFTTSCFLDSRKEKKGHGRGLTKAPATVAAAKAAVAAAATAAAAPVAAGHLDAQPGKVTTRSSDINIRLI